LLPAQNRLHWIEKFPQIVAEQTPQEVDILTREISGKSENIYEEELIKNLPVCLQQFNTIAPDLQSIILEVVQAVCEGMKIDLSYFPTQPGAPVKAFTKTTDLTHYCRLMGGKPGLFWTKLIQKSTLIPVVPDLFLDWGQKIGDALQIVNILRDLPKDLQLGRCYFPLEDLKQFGLTPQDLLNTQNSARFEPIKQKWISWGLERLAYAKMYFPLIPKSQIGQRAAVAWPVLWTADTLHKVSQSTDLLDVYKRVKISRATVYFTVLCTPLLFLSNTMFSLWLTKKIKRCLKK
ncbi:MAG: squalene/phytoene synthase family protein, partial [Elusimicrobiaceae bacterium]|nr:squalene/phytoene synthase family protein [Elusimicrobiaceae bacterium]